MASHLVNDAFPFIMVYSLFQTVAREGKLIPIGDPYPHVSWMPIPPPPVVGRSPLTVSIAKRKSV